jgi:hypothetical protein
MWLVLVTRHFWDDKFTTQFSVKSNQKTKEEARDIVRLFYPSTYMWFIPENASNTIGFCAHFTGEIKRI